MHYKYQKINPKQGGSYLDSPDCINNKIVALNHDEIGKNFINKYKWEETNVPSGKYSLKKSEKNNVTFALNVLYAKKMKNISCSYILFKGEGWYYLAVKKLSALLKGITTKDHGYLYCLNCPHSFATENKQKRYVKRKFL